MGQRWTDDPRIDRHNRDEYAHGEALKGIRTDITALQKFTWMVTGGLTVIATLATAGLFATLIGRLHL